MNLPLCFLHYMTKRIRLWVIPLVNRVYHFLNYMILLRTNVLIYNWLQEDMHHLWFKHRTYILTGYYMHSICHTNPNNPSLSLLFKVCSPADHCFKTKQTHCGCEHESKVIQDNELLMAPKHVHLKVEHSCVFFVKSDIPYMGALQYLLVYCS